MTAPKLFVSYSWSSVKHEQWVVGFATELRESGVDVILDKWDLKEGHDAVAFMEQMVTNTEINKVVIICDEKYVTKADGRAGGVGTETQIISKEVYEKQNQEKFVAVVAEKNKDGGPFLPTYYKSRIYIDLCESDQYAENFERLLRWIFNKPLYVKPDLGSMPSFLSGGEHVSLGTTAIFRRCIDAIKNDKASAVGAFNEYCNSFASNLERFRLLKSEGEFDDAVVKNIEEFVPYRNEVIQLFIAIAQYSSNPEFTQRLHRFLESLIPYMHSPADVSQRNEWGYDNFRFIVHELFLHALATLLKFERFDQANYLLEQPYYLPGNSEHGRDVTISFVEFREHMKSLEDRKKRLGLRRLSLRSDLLKERSKGTGIEFRYLMQADFVAFMRAEIESKDGFSWWWPETLLYLDRFNSPFEIFARSVSEAYFKRTKILLAIESPKDLDALLKSFLDGSRKLPSWDHNSFKPKELLGYEQLASRP